MQAAREGSGGRLRMEIRLAILLAFALVLGALVKIETEAVGDRTRTSVAAARRDEAVAPGLRLLDDAIAGDELACPQLACGRTPLDRIDASSDAPAQVQSETTRWLSIALRLPADMPADDRPALVVLSRRWRGALSGVQTRRLASAVRTSQPLERSVAPYLDWTEHEAGRGCVEVPLAGATEEAVILLRSRYLYLAPAEVDPRAQSEIELAPALGGYVAGRCTLPREVRRRSPGDTNVEIELYGHPRDGSIDRRNMECAADGSFELWGLVPNLDYSIVARACSLPPARTDVRVEPGRRHEIVLAFEPGVVARGVVVDRDGRPVAGARVSLAGREEAGAPRDQSDELGRFELAGLPEGECRLIASSASGTGSAALSTRNGQVLSGLCLELSGQAEPRLAGRCESNVRVPR